MKRTIAQATLMLVFLAPAARTCADAEVRAEASPDPAVQSGRKAIAGSPHAPWYDSQADDVRRINYSPPPPKPPSRPWNPNFSWLSYLIWGLLAIVLAALAWMLIRAFIMREQRLATQQGQAVDLTGTHADRVEQLPIPIRRPAGDLLSEARYHYEQGNFREAIVYLYSHELVELDRQQMIHLARGKTNRQYLRELKTRRLRDLLELTVVTFEDAFFGQLDIGRQRFEACWNRLNDFNAMLRGATA